MYRVFEIISGGKSRRDPRYETQRSAVTSLEKSGVTIAAKEHDGPHLDIIANSQWSGNNDCYSAMSP